MNVFRCLLACAVALTIGAGGVAGSARAQLGNGSAAIGTGRAIGAVPETASPEAAKVGAPRAIGQCVTNRTAFRTQDNEVSTTSFTFVTMANTHFPVTHQAGCLVVDLAGMVANASALGAISVRAWIGGVGAAEPPEISLGRPIEALIYDTRSMRFVFPNVPAGTHTVRIDWRSQTGSTVSVNERTLTVQYRQ